MNMKIPTRHQGLDECTHWLVGLSSVTGRKTGGLTESETPLISKLSRFIFFFLLGNNKKPEFFAVQSH